MAVLPPFFGPRAAARDLAAFLRQRSPEKLVGAGLAVLATLLIVFLFIIDSRINTAPPPRIVYVENYRPGRTDAEIVAQQKKDQAAREAALRERQRQFQKLGRQLGIE